MTTLEVTLGLVPQRSDEVLERLRSDVAPWLRRLPGFVTSRWLLTEEHHRCTIIVDLVDDDAVQSLRAALVPCSPSTARSWWCERIDTVTDLGLAERPSITL